MSDSDRSKLQPDADLLATTSPFVFISHDARDAELAEAFSKLLKSVSAGMIKTFRSSDKTGTEGIDFGEEWYKRLMTTLQSTSDVICLFTERSVDRPWILFEAGVAKGKLNTQVVGVALGVPLNRVNVGPFYQFQNMDDSEGDLAKLISQLARRVPGLELDADVVRAQVASFKVTEAGILKKTGAPVPIKEREEATDENSVAKIVEEMKALPSRVAERLLESDDRMLRRRKTRRFHPMMFEEMMHLAGEPGDPVVILLAASLVRENAPWLYELATEVYQASKSGDPIVIKEEIVRLERVTEIFSRGAFLDELGAGDEETYMWIREFPRMLRHMLARIPVGVPRATGARNRRSAGAEAAKNPATGLINSSSS